MPVVSVITPIYNSADYLADTIESVQLQSFEAWELILVDDCSTDGSLALAQKYGQQDSRIRLICLEQNSGAAVARNTAIAAARGRYIAFLDSDDMWLEHKLAVQLDFMQRHDYAFSYAAYARLDQQGSELDHVVVPDRLAYHDLLKVNSIGCLTAVYDSAKLGKVYMPLIRKRQDWGLWLAILRREPYAYGVQQILGRYRMRQGSISASKKSAALYTWRLYREVEKLSLPRAVYYFAHYAAYGLLRNKFKGLAKAIGILD